MQIESVMIFPNNPQTRDLNERRIINNLILNSFSFLEILTYSSYTLYIDRRTMNGGEKKKKKKEKTEKKREDKREGKFRGRVQSIKNVSRAEIIKARISRG